MTGSKMRESMLPQVKNIITRDVKFDLISIWFSHIKYTKYRSYSLQSWDKIEAIGVSLWKQCTGVQNISGLIFSMCLSFQLYNYVLGLIFQISLLFQFYYYVLGLIFQMQAIFRRPWTRHSIKRPGNLLLIWIDVSFLIQYIKMK